VPGRESYSASVRDADRRASETRDPSLPAGTRRTPPRRCRCICATRSRSRRANAYGADSDLPPARADDEATFAGCSRSRRTLRISWTLGNFRDSLRAVRRWVVRDGRQLMPTRCDAGRARPIFEPERRRPRAAPRHGAAAERRVGVARERDASLFLEVRPTTRWTAPLYPLRLPAIGVGRLLSGASRPRGPWFWR